MLKLLLKNRIQAALSSLFRSRRNGTQRSQATGLLLAAALVVYFFFLLRIAFQSIAEPFSQFGLGWLYFAFLGIADFALVLFMVVFTAQKQLYDATDNDLLLSLPIPPRDILGSRMLMLLLMSWGYQLLVVPAGIYVWWETGQMSIASLIISIVCFIFLPFLILAAAALLGWVLQLVTLRVKRKSLVTTVLCVAFLGAYFYYYAKLQDYLVSMTAAAGAQTAASLQNIPPLYYLGTAIADGNFLHMLIFIVMMLVPFAIAYALLSRSFIRLVTTKKGGRHIKYRAKSMKTHSPLAALTIKELRHLGSSSVYIMNGAIGSLLLLIAAGALLIKQGALSQLLAELPFEPQLLQILAAMMLCLIGSMNMLSAPSVSLEGRTLWLAQSLPLANGAALFAKVLMHIIVTLPPCLLTGIALGIILKAGLGYTLLLVLAVSLFVIFTACFGVILNLRFPRLDWVSETAVIKQSTSTMLSLFGDMAFAILPFLLYFMFVSELMSLNLFLALLCALLVIVNIVCINYLRGKGAEKFNSLS